MRQGIHLAVYASKKNRPSIQSCLAALTDVDADSDANHSLHFFPDIPDLYFFLFGQQNAALDALILSRDADPKRVDELSVCVSRHFPAIQVILLSNDDLTPLPGVLYLPDDPEGMQQLLAYLQDLKSQPPALTKQSAWRRKTPVQQDLEWLNNRYQILVNGAGEGILGLDREGVITFANPIATQLLGADVTDLIGRPFSEFSLDSPLNKGSSPESFTRKQEDRRRVGRGLITRPDKQMLYVEYTLSFVGEHQDDTVSVMVIEDISERIKFEAHLKRLAHTDALTQLYNRHYFEKALKRELNNPRRSEAPLVLALVDLDGFKQINDGYGHGVGDRLLVLVANRLKDQVRRGDLVARLGGDEFAILIKRTPLDQVRQLADKIAFHLHQPFLIDEHTLQISASIGISELETEAMDAKAGLEQADLAMYSVKRSGKNGVAVFSPPSSRDESSLTGA